MLKNLSLYLDKRFITILFLGFSSGLPLLLVLSTLSFWLKDTGVSIAVIGLFSLVRIPYGLKFLWSPLIDGINLPYLSKVMGRRRSWAILTQIMLMFAIFSMALTSPEKTPMITALFALLVAFFSASQDIVIDAYRIEILKEDEQGAGSAMIVLGYRIAMLFSGAGALWLATKVSWSTVYIFMSFACLVGIVTILLAQEPQSKEEKQPCLAKASLLSKTSFFIKVSIIAPLKDFIQRPNAFYILLFIMIYKLCDTYIGPMANPFYVELGFSKAEIASIIQVFGMGATITGGIIGGIIVKRYGIIKSLFIGGFLQALSNLMYVLQAIVGNNSDFLTATILIENLSGGIGTTAFIAYMSSLCNIAYTATQYALLTSFMAFARDAVASTSGYMVQYVGFLNFFIITTLMAIPSLLLLLFMVKKYPQEIKPKERYHK